MTPAFATDREVADLLSSALRMFRAARDTEDDDASVAWFTEGEKLSLRARALLMRWPV